MQPRPKRKHKTCYSALLNFLSHCTPGNLLLAYLVLLTPAVLANELHTVSEHPESFLRPDTTTVVVSKGDCFQAAPKCLFEVTPSLKKARHFQIWQTCDAEKVAELNSKSFENQVSEMKIIGSEFCYGVVSIPEPRSSSDKFDDEEIQKGLNLIDQLIGLDEEMIEMLDNLRCKVNGPVLEFSDLLKQLEELGNHHQSALDGRTVTIQYGSEDAQQTSIPQINLATHVCRIRSIHNIQSHIVPSSRDQTLNAIQAATSEISNHARAIEQQRNLLSQLSPQQTIAMRSVDLNYPDRVVAHRAFR